MSLCDLHQRKCADSHARRTHLGSQLLEGDVCAVVAEKDGKCRQPAFGRLGLENRRGTVRRP